VSRPRTASNLQIPVSRALDAYRVDVRRFLGRGIPTGHTRRMIERGATLDAGVWDQISELEWVASLVPERYGGADANLQEASVLLEEMGRVLFVSPFLSSAVFGTLAVTWLADDQAREQLLPRLASGRVRVCYAHETAVGMLTATGGVDTTRVTGTVAGVIGVDAADRIVGVARRGDELVCVELAAAGQGVRIMPAGGIDPTRPTATVHLTDAPAAILGVTGQASLRMVAATAATLLAAEMTGGARRCLEMSIEWAGLREQFGRPIGSFQAIKHRCVDMLVAVEAATAATRLATRLGDAASADDHAAAAWMAAGVAARAYRRAAADTIQIHGGMGYTWDHEAHLHLKRAKGSAALLGGTSEPDRQLAVTLGL
jgi:alkylation response protein AidB-like acyl-CoA dehydrogenase